MARYDGPRPQGTPCWFDLMSPDVSAAATFYERLFGWTYDASGPEYGHYHLAKVDGRPAAGIGQKPEGAEMPSAWTVYLAADDAAAMADQAVRGGGRLLQGPMEVPAMGHMAIIQDPGGAVFGLWQPLGHYGAAISHEPGTMGWCEVNVPDAEQARSFYEDLMGVTSRRLGTDEIPTTYYVLTKDGTDVGGILEMNEAWEGVPPHWMAYFEVRDANQTVEVAKEAGGTVSVSPFDTPYGRIAVVTDPFGGVFSVNATRGGS